MSAIILQKRDALFLLDLQRAYHPEKFQKFSLMKNKLQLLLNDICKARIFREL